MVPLTVAASTVASIPAGTLSVTFPFTVVNARARSGDSSPIVTSTFPFTVAASARSVVEI